MKFYYTPGACSLAPHIVAAEGGFKLELEKADLKTHKTESGADFNAINPKGYVPALTLDDGALLTENVALLTLFRDGAGLTPKDDLKQCRLLEWLAFITSEIQKSFAPLFQEDSDDAVQKAKEKILKRLAFVEAKLASDYLMGSDFSPADAYLYVMLGWSEKMDIDIAGLPNVSDFKECMAQRPGVRAALGAERLS